jgi:FkbM family methyltransferase
MYAYPLSNICSRVEAFEPQPSCAAALEGLGRNVRVHRVALSDSEGELMLSVPLVNGIAYTGLATFGVYDGPHETLRVPVRRLDAYHLMNVGFIKIDVEGHEEQVLRGAEATLRREKPTLLIEIEQRHLDHPMTDVFRYLERLGYVGSFLYDGVWRSLDTFSYERDQHAYLNAVSKGDDAAVRGKYVNNFLFTPKG